MSERDMRQRVVRELHALDAFAVENPAWPGTPDVNYKEGWIELKWARAWPAQGGVLQLDHFTKQQKYFLRQRWRVGGNAFLLLNVKREWLLFDGDVAAQVVGQSDREDLILHARAYWPLGLAGRELAPCLSR